jgi:hypothetical protein
VSARCSHCENITLEQAFDLFVNAARQMGNRSMSVTDIHKVKVLRTLINGEIVYETP